MDGVAKAAVVCRVADAVGFDADVAPWRIPSVAVLEVIGIVLRLGDAC